MGDLIVSIATLTWTIYRDLKADRKAKPPTAAVLKKVRQQVEWEGGIEANQHDKIITTIVEETVKAADYYDE